ncbi:MAG: bamB [Lacunisphaera sp.]|nr:bamB [Lacunisphaera sp.]
MLWPFGSPRRFARLLVTGFMFGAFSNFAGAQTPTAPAAAVAPAPDPIEGDWLGTVTAPQGRTEIGFGFHRGADGKLILTFHMPAMFAYGAQMGPFVEKEEGGYLVTAFPAHLRLEGDRLTGTFGLSALPLELKRAGTFSVPPPEPAYPAAPAPQWSRQLSSYTWASPVVRDDLIYVGTKDGQFHAVRANDGSELWTWTGVNRIDGRAVVTDDIVYFVDGKIELVALNRADGTLRWRQALHDEALAGKPAPDNPTFNRRTATPLVLGDTVYCGSSDGGLYALNAATGKKLWRFDARSPVFSGITRIEGDLLSFGTMDGSVVVLNRRTQQEVRRMKTGGGVVTTPLFTAGRAIVGSRDYMLYGFNVADGSLAWKFSYWFSWVESTPQLADGVMYVGGSDFRRITALNPADGHVFWSTDVGGIAWGWPLVTNDTVFIGTVAQNIPGTLIRHRGGILALDRKTGAVKWQLLSPEPAINSFGGYAGSLALAGDKVIAVGYEGVLLALPAR